MSTSTQSACQARASGSGSLARASELRTPAKSLSTFQDVSAAAAVSRNFGLAPAARDVARRRARVSARLALGAELLARAASSGFGLSWP